MKRAIILVMDSLGIGASEDAHMYGDEAANTLGSIATQCAAGLADNVDRQGPLKIPNLMRLGLGAAQTASSGEALQGVNEPQLIKASYGFAIEQSKDKDTPSGHWEMAGVPVPFKWGTFPKTQPCFPAELIAQFIEQADLPGILGNCHASGTEIIKSLGEEHIKTGKPICYTSADSVFQIAAHERHFGLQRLLEISAIAKELVNELNITRVIARPFVGETATTFQRTSNRKDLTTPPIDTTLLDALKAAGGEVVSVGKIADIFAGRGITQCVKGNDNMALFDAMLDCLKTAEDNTLVFVNFVDFDSHFGHRRDVIGYAKALEAFDARLPELEQMMQGDDVALITADHGCDPTFPGSDHTREHVPVLFFGPSVKAQLVGARQSFADMGQTLASHFGLAALKHGQAIKIN
ncbi:phosphopentomutase [Marinicella sp. S1101]|uniref:phosphopentomutase n=1 Tax=Marinicella marina TaxID=2996016 RepID=UPI002260EAD5|nr:phosphopentomutase [Marinicella marina]MCX7555074.1 phosphopentomutase [Marinicella marina]MDJ1141382.1 phosphopentomutase [Marinicella marina]